MRAQILRFIGDTIFSVIFLAPDYKDQSTDFSKRKGE